MSNKYLNIPYEKAVEVLKALPDDKLAYLLNEYQISEEDGILGLAEIISDKELIDLGYRAEDTEDTENLFTAPYDNVISFLETLDRDTLEELAARYDTSILEDIAVAITDSELQSLGYGQDENTRHSAMPGVGSNMKDDYIDSTLHIKQPLEYDENLDYLEDVPSDIDFMILDPDNHIFGVQDEIYFNQFKESLDPNLVERCEIIEEDLGLNCIPFQVTPVSFDEQQQVPEDVVINKELNPLLFDNEHKLKEDVKQQLLNYVNAFIEQANEKGIKIDYSDIVLSGSNAGYLYTPTSDVDIHIVSSEPIDEDIFEQLKGDFDLYEIENPLTIGDENNSHAVELGIEDGYNIVMDNKDARRYSLLDDNWVGDSDKFEVYTEAYLSAVEGYEDIVDEYVAKIDDVVDNDRFAAAKDLKQELRQNRSSDLANYGALSMGNVVFKELRNNGAYGKLREYIKSKEEMIA